MTIASLLLHFFRTGFGFFLYFYIYSFFFLIIFRIFTLITLIRIIWWFWTTRFTSRWKWPLKKTTTQKPLGSTKTVNDFTTAKNRKKHFRNIPYGFLCSAAHHCPLNQNGLKRIGRQYVSKSTHLCWCKIHPILEFDLLALLHHTGGKKKQTFIWFDEKNLQDKVNSGSTGAKYPSPSAITLEFYCFFLHFIKRKVILIIYLSK